MPRCIDCANIETLQTRATHYWCSEKKKWIPVRKYDRKRKCGDFKPLIEEPTIASAKDELQWPNLSRKGLDNVATT